MFKEKCFPGLDVYCIKYTVLSVFNVQQKKLENLSQTIFSLFVSKKS